MNQVLVSAKLPSVSSVKGLSSSQLQTKKNSSVWNQKNLTIVALALGALTLGGLAYVYCRTSSEEIIKNKMSTLQAVCESTQEEIKKRTDQVNAVCKRSFEGLFEALEETIVNQSDLLKIELTESKKCWDAMIKLVKERAVLNQQCLDAWDIYRS